MGIFRAAHGLAVIGWLGTVLPLLTGPGLLALFEMQSWRDQVPTSMLVAGMLAVSLWMLIRRVRVGPLRGRWTLWSSVAGLVFTMIGGLIAFGMPADWTLWAGPLLLGPAFFMLAVEPFLASDT